MPGRVGADEIQAGLRRVGDHLRRSRTFTLFGGCDMSVRGLKPSTKDADAVVDPAPPFHELIGDLRAAGFDYLRNEAIEAIFPEAEQVEMPDWVTFWNGITLDLFPPGRIFGKLAYTPTIDARSSSWFQHGPLHVRLADPTAIFLFKSVTGRWEHPNQPERDLDDLDLLASRGAVDYAFLRQEWARQLPGAANPAEARRLAGDAVAWLRRERGLTIPWDP